MEISEGMKIRWDTRGLLHKVDERLERGKDVA